MKIIKNIAAFICFIGCIGIPGAIEFDEWLVPLTFIIAGGLVYLMIERSWFIDEEDHTSHHSDSRPKYLS